MSRAALVALALAGACRVDDLALDGKQCPCAAGWTCDDATDTCVRDPDVDAAADAAGADGAPDGAAIDARSGDGGGIDAAIDAGAIDAPAGPSCLGSAGGATLFSDDFPDLIGWTTRGGAWSAAGGEAVQSSTAGGLTYAFPAGTESFADYRVAARARRTGGATTGAMELAARIQSSGDGQYHCAWVAVSGDLRLAWTRTNGSEGGVLAQMTVNVGAIPGYDATAPVVLEARAVGTQLTCCVRGVAGATVTISDTRYATGAPGLRTTSQASAFDDFAVSAP
ncbi:MAG: hypothetical protein JNK64_07690 [Myxococcales bacterium]|nr:hypothetical protein [Myxococcales bacterium]